MSQRGRQTICLWIALVTGILCVALPLAAWSASDDNLYYRIGGGGPVSAAAGTGYQPGQLGLGLRWNQGSACSGLNPRATVANQLNGATRGFHNMMGSVIQNATAAVAALPAMIIQRAAPGLYDLLSNGVLQGRLDFNKAKTSCKAMAGRAADVLMSGGWQRQAQAENWRRVAAQNGDAVAAEQTVEAVGGDQGVTWVGGEQRGGETQPPIAVTRDTAVAGYDVLNGRSDPTSTQPVAGGGQGWGSVPTASGTWAGAGSNAGPAFGHCRGGMCTVWGSPDDAADWITGVLGEKKIRTCSGCEKIQTTSGSGLMRALQDQQNEIQDKLAAMVNGNEPINADNLREVSAGATLSVTKPVILALRHDPQRGLLTHRLAAEMALARTLTQALWARRVLLAGADVPGIADNEAGQKAIHGKLTHLDRGIQALRTELSVRKALANNTATTILERRSRHNLGHAPDETKQRNPVMGHRNPNDNFEQNP